MVAVASLFAILEVATSEPIRLEPTPPGLVEEKTLADQDYDGASTIIRNGVPRPAGLSTNPLELSAVMALALPFAAYLLFSSRRWIGRVWFLACTVIIAVTVVLSISRTGFLAVGAMLLVALAANVRRPMRVVLGLTAVIALGATVATLVPASVDATDAAVREGRHRGPEPRDPAPGLRRARRPARPLSMVRPRPKRARAPTSHVTGHGIILDNQYLLQIAETGVIGLVGLLMLLMSAGAAAVGRIRGPTTERGLWVAAAGAVVGFAIMCATFDALRFAQATALLMVVVGLLSASDLGGEDQGLEASRVGAV